MKKLFISCPMKGRTEENIRDSIARMHKIAEAYFGQQLEVIPSYIPDQAPYVVNRRIWYLGESIKMMAEAEYYIGITYCDAFAGCCVENEVAQHYDIPRFFVDLSMMPDACEIEKQYYTELRGE